MTDLANTPRLVFSVATNVSDFSDFERIATEYLVSLKLINCVPKNVISSYKLSINVVKIAKISCR